MFQPGEDVVERDLKSPKLRERFRDAPCRLFIKRVAGNETLEARTELTTMSNDLDQQDHTLQQYLELLTSQQAIQASFFPFHF